MARKYKLLKAFSITMLIAMLNQLLFPLTAKALTSGPSQPEVQSFTPIGTSDLVDLFTGDFNYNIPLLDVGGYPVNLSYQSGIQMDQEASWVGLGWNLNVGAIVRNMRGVPDEFGGGEEADEITYKRQMKENETWGVSLGKNFEIVGIKPGQNSSNPNKDSITHRFGGPLSLSLQFNTFTGFDMSLNIVPGIRATDDAKSKWNASLGINVSGREGSTVTPKLNYSIQLGDKEKSARSFQNGVYTSINSRSGLSEINLSAGLAKARPSVLKMLGLNTWDLGFQLAHPTFRPSIDFPMRTVSQNFSFQTGAEASAWTALNGVSIKGFYSRQELQKNTIVAPAYGYLNLQEGKSVANAVLDFNREKDGGLNKETPHLPLTNLTYDTYAVTGQGVSGSFRAYRGDVGAVFDRASHTSSNGLLNIGLQYDAGDGSALGVDWNPSWFNAENGKWLVGNNALDRTDFQASNPSSALYQPATFRMMGEQIRMDDAFFTERGGIDPVRPKLAGTLGIHTEPAWTSNTSDAVSSAIASTIVRDKRIPGNTAISALSAYEARTLGLQTDIPSYSVNGGIDAPTSLNRWDPASGRKKHHPSEFTVVSGDGSRHVYGIPAYNVVQKEVTFSIGSSSYAAGPESYNHGEYSYTSASSEEPEGRDEFSDVTETDPYAHSYLLSAYLSADYEDLTGDGPSPDDLGTYVKFNYSRDHAAYKWRAPFGYKKAKHQVGLRADPTDDKASYTYGEKEIWYLHSIETRDYIALFQLSERRDGHGVDGEDGGISSAMTLQKLERIDLYARREFLDPPTGQSAVPIKSVHFLYDYSLCEDVLNNDGGAADPQAHELDNQGGKLTLKHVYFTWYNSQKGKMNSYTFNYEGSNPDYNSQESDRWGNYTPSLNNSLNLLKNADYPYVTQDGGQAATYAAAWSMTSIDLPSGGRIEVEYEADDYAYVQDRRAMRMFSIAGLSNLPHDPGATSRSVLYSSNPKREYNYLYFNLEEPITQRGDGLDDKRFYDDYIEGLGQYLYFKCLVELNALSWAPRPGEHKEFVAGYAELEKEGDKIVSGLDASSISGGKYTRGYIKVKLESVQDRDQGNGLQVHPIAKSAWDMMALYQNHLIYRGSTAYDPSQAPFEGVIRGMLGAFRDIFLIFSSRNRWMRNQQKYGQNIDKAQSFIRLNEPQRIKYGGGLRVKNIKMHDHWDEMSGVNGSEFMYEQEYDYTLVEKVVDLTTGDLVDRHYSSGVAAYEPLLGGDENPFHQPVKYEKSIPLAPNERYFQEEPVGESMFPSPTVGYSKVTVRNQSHPGVRKNATGYTVNEFYTAKDFPTKVRNTSPKKRRSVSRFIPSFLKAGKDDFITAAEGFVIERNDMHGKPKSVFAYPEPNPLLPASKLVGREISGVRYFYKTEADDASQLNNEVEVILPDGSTTSATLGMNMDMVTDTREYLSASKAVDIQAQVDLNVPISFPMPSAIPALTLERTRFRSAVVTKTIDRYGILEKVVKYDRQAQIPTENVAFDSETGQPLLTRTWNEFSQPIYDLVYPAHWAYDEGMGQAYKTLEYRKADVEFDPSLTNKIDVGSDVSHFAVGDVVYLDGSGGLNKKGPYWINAISGTNIYVVDREGAIRDKNNTLSGQFDVKIIRSARKNMAGAGIGTVQLLEESPIVSNNLNVLAQKDHILAASAVEYDDAWKMLCRKYDPEQGGGGGGGGPVDTCDWALYLNDIGNMVNTSGFHIPLPHGLSYVGTIPAYGPGGPPTSDIPITMKFYDCNGVQFYHEVILLPTSSFACNNGLIELSNVSVAPDPGNPDRQLVSFTLSCTTSNGPASVNYFSQSWPCPELPCTTSNRLANVGICPAVNSIVNPFVQGLAHHWRPKTSYTYLEDRDYVSTTQPRLRQDGVLADFVPFWQYSSGQWYSDWEDGNPIPNTPHKRWQYTSVAEEYHPRGIEVESSDPIITYSAAILGYDQSLVTAMGQNTYYRQLAFEGFEDYVLRDATASQCELFHWDFIQFEPLMSTEAAHSGLRSLKVDGYSPTVMSETFNCSSNGGVTGDKEYILGCGDCLDLFEPIDGKYALLAWVKQVNSGSDIPALKADRARIIILLEDNNGQFVGNPITVVPKGVMIDGWQRMEYEFEIPMWVEKVYVSFENTDPSKGPVYFDDVRISPHDAIVKSYVYHPYNRRLMAELDPNHYATFYEYDEDGSLIRVKKETERGIHTVQEARTSIRKISLSN